MTIGKDRAVLRRLDTLFDEGVLGNLTDGQLLERFTSGRGETPELAFTVLLERHGPMVLRVCRSVLANSHETQDAFQATFLVLLKKSRSLWVRDSLGPWLYQVAYRTASCARATASRRRRLERNQQPAQEGRPEPDEELRRALHEEIARLPERFRTPLVLCDLEGRTHEQAARHLGWPVGTVKSRIARGRDHLRKKLYRRGHKPEASLFAILLNPAAVESGTTMALIDSTADLIGKSMAAKSVSQGAASSLAQGVLKSMWISRGIKIASLLLVFGTTASGVKLLAQKEGSGQERSPQEAATARFIKGLPVTTIKLGPLKVSAQERGVIEAIRVADVVGENDMPSTIISMVPEGTKVTKGQIVVELDPQGLLQMLPTLQLKTDLATVNYQNAKLAREVAEIALVEYQEGIFRQEQMSLQGAVNLATSSVKKSTARLERIRIVQKRLHDMLAAKGAERSPADIAAELDVEERVDDTEEKVLQQTMALEQAQTRLKSLLEYSHPKTIKELKYEIEQKRAVEFEKQSVWDREKRGMERDREQIAKTKIRAPIDGFVVYPQGPVHGSTLDVGTIINFRQKVFSIVDCEGPMQVTTRVKESIVDQIEVGQKVVIGVDFFKSEELRGEVISVASLPEPPAPTRTANGHKYYQTRVKIEKGLPSLRPGMTAHVEILIKQLDSVLTVPVSAVVSLDGKNRVALKGPEGGFTWREVTLGIANNERVEIKEGLEVGEQVIVDPADLIHEKETQRIRSHPTPPASRPSTPQ